MCLTVSPQEVIFSCFLLCQHVKPRVTMISLQQQHLGMCGKDDCYHLLLNECIYVTFSHQVKALWVLACVWYVWCPLRKQGCVGANLFVVHSHCSLFSSGGKKTPYFQQVEHTLTEQCVLGLYEGLCGSHLLFELTSHSALLSTTNNRCIHTFSQAFLEDQQQEVESGINKTWLFCISEAQVEVLKQKWPF